MPSRLLVHPHQVVFPKGVQLTRLVVGMGVRVTKIVTGINQTTIHADVYGDVLAVGATIYPTLLVVWLSM